MPCRPRKHLIIAPLLAACVLATLATSAVGETTAWTLANGGEAKVNELVRLDVRLKTPFDGRRLVVTEDGREVAYQVEVLEGALAAVHKGHIWVCTELATGASRKYTVTTDGQPRKFEPKVKVAREGDSYVLNNGLVAVKLPAAAGKLAGPVEGIRAAGGSWVGASRWRTTCVFNSLNPVVEGDGTVFGRVLLRYIFNDPNYGGPRVPFSYVTVTLKPGRRAVEIEESFELTDGSAWVLELGEAFRLKQSDKDGERARSFAAADQKQVVGATAHRMEQWTKAEQNRIRAVGGVAGVSFELPSNEGARCWLLSIEPAGQK